jgi:hypothetical protein
MSDVFISYSSKNRDVVSTIVAELERHGIRTFWDAHIAAGDSWQDTLQRHLSAAKAVLVVWSPSASESEWVRSEAEFAISHKKYVPINLGDRFSVPVPFDRYMTARWDGPGSIAQLVQAFASLGVISGLPTQAATPTVPAAKGFAFISHVEEDVPIVAKISDFLKTREYSY